MTRIYRGRSARASDDIEVVAIALWREEAVRAAPNIVKMRTPEAFADESDDTRMRWRRSASAALRALGIAHEDQ